MGCSSTVNANNSKITTTYGGGIYAGGAVNITGQSWEFNANHARSPDNGNGGGAIYSNGAITLDGSFHVLGNTSIISGGALFSNTSVTLKGTGPYKFNRNTSTKRQRWGDL